MKHHRTQPILILALFALLGLFAGPAAFVAEGKIPPVPRKSAPAKKSSKSSSSAATPSSSTRSSKSKSGAASKPRPSAVEKSYWELCQQQLNAAGDPQRLSEVARAALTLGQANKSNPFGARAVVLSGDIKASFADLQGALADYIVATEIFKANPKWKESADYLPYLGLRSGDAQMSMSRAPDAVTQWKKTLLAWPNSAFASQLKLKVLQANNKLMPPERAWSENNQFLGQVLAVPGLAPEGRDALSVSRLEVLAGAAERGFLPAADLVAEIDKFLATVPAGRNPNLDKFRLSLQRIRADLVSKSKGKPTPPQVVYRRLSDVVTSASAIQTSVRRAPAPPHATPAPVVSPTPAATPAPMPVIPSAATLPSRGRHGK